MTTLSKEEQELIIQKLNNWEILVLPTDTIYGLSAKVDSKTLKEINQLKHAEVQKPLIILVSDLTMAGHLVKANKTDLELLNSKQPTTIIYQSKTDPKETLALRLVQRTDLKTIIQQTGPLYSTSVNYHQEPPRLTLDDLTAFAPSLTVFYVGELNHSPSRIYDSLTRKYLR